MEQPEVEIEYRVVVDKSGIKSVDYYFNQKRAEERMGKLKNTVKGNVFIQSRLVTEWKVIAGDATGKV